MQALRSVTTALIIVLVLALGIDVRAADAPTIKPSASFTHPDGVRTVALSSDGKTLATAGANGNDPMFKLWNVATGKEQVPAMTPKGPVFRMRALANNQFALVGDFPMVEIVDVAGKSIKQLDARPGSTRDVDALAVTPSGKYLAVGPHELRTYDVAGAKAQAEITPPGSFVYDLSLTPDGKILSVLTASGNADEIVAKLSAYDTASGKLLYDPVRNGGSVLAQSPDGKTLACLDCWGTVHLYDPATGKESAKYKLNEDILDGDALAWSPDGRMLAVALEKQPIQLVDPATGKVLAQCPGHTEKVDALVFSADSKVLASGSRDKTAKLWPVPR